MNNIIENTFTSDDYEMLQREVLYKGVFTLARLHIRYKLFDGSWSHTIKREILERLSAAAVLPYDPVRDEIILIEQFRPGAIFHEHNPWLIEIVAGILDSEQDSNDVAKREAEEEAGCVISDLLPIYEYFISPGGSNEYLHLYVGKTDTSNIERINGLAEEDENIRATVMSSEQAFTLLRDGLIKTSPAIISLQWLQLNRTMLQNLWTA
ncbi:MAG: NUDIX domain-containing protein [Gammaproteobacteria bacterium]|nr:NUDIX domain-containing protein [Gammaproteobacteria bacterium]